MQVLKYIPIITAYEKYDTATQEGQDWMKLRKYLVSQNGESPIGIDAKWIIRKGKKGMGSTMEIVANNSDTYDTVKTVALVAYFEDMKIEIKNQLDNFVKKLYLQEGETREEYSKLAMSAMSFPNVLKLYNENMQVGKLNIPRLPKEQKAQEFYDFLSRLQNLGYIQL